jgi:hypothetical protein
MKSKTIKAILNGKLNKWMNSIDDPNIQKTIKDNTIVTGGAIASMLLNEEVKDFDIYFRTREACEEVATYYVNKFNENNDNFGAELKTEECCRVKIYIQSDGVAGDLATQGDDILNEPFEDVYDVLKVADDIDADHLESGQGENDYRPVFLSANAITLSDKIQIVIRFYGEPEEIHENYDFTHCTNIWTSWDNELDLKKEALECLMNKELRYQGSKYPICSVIRTRKFISRGYTINAGQYLKMCFQISELDLSDIDVLEDQLIGVDSTYFQMFIDKIKKQSEDGVKIDISSDYVVSVIDRIF